MKSHSFSNAQVWIVIALISGVVFIADSISQFGVVFWVLYLIALALTVLQSNPNVPLLVGAIQILFIGISFSLKPDSGAELQAMINRAGGAAAILAVAYMARRVIMERLETATLLWHQRGQSVVSDSLIGETAVGETANTVLNTLAQYLGAQVGLLHQYEKGVLVPAGAYGCRLDDAANHAGGLAAEVVKSGSALLVSDLPADYIQVSSNTGRAAARHVVIAPIKANGRTVGVIELGFMNRSERFDQMLTFLSNAADTIGTAVRSAAYREHLRELLEQTQRQSEEMQVQQEELRVSNEELEEQGRALRESQARMENQQAELEQTNVQLEEHTQRLARQKEDLLRAQRVMQTHAQDLNRANQYKSEFLANMSHELRTPLNSSLILSQILSGPQSESLSASQRQDYARTIHDANNDLLNLINDILDLSKIEAGHVELDVEPISVSGIVEPLRQMFDPIAGQKNVPFIITVDESAPAVLQTDRARLGQILKNLLSNAFKFTASGSVELIVSQTAPQSVLFQVRDSGIGIGEEQQSIIFEAFRQADGTTSRKYGGTGLGLSISRELVKLLGGEISVQSTPGKGSVFSVTVSTELQNTEVAQPSAHAPALGLTRNASNTGGEAPPAPAHSRPATSVPASDTVASPTGSQTTDVGEIDPATSAFFQNIGVTPMQGEGDANGPVSGAIDKRRLILLIEDDPRFSAVLETLAQDLKFECLVASSGGQALELARAHRPKGILLDVNLPDQSGLAVLEQLKRDPATRHIPIHMMSVEDHIQTALELGAVGYALKPVAREALVEAFSKIEEKFESGLRRVLVVEDDETLRTSIAQLLRADDVEITLAGTAAEALDAVNESTFDCVVMDLMLPDASGYDLLERMAEGAKYIFPPVIVYTGRALTRDEELRLRRYSRSIIIKGARSPERLLDEVTLFLHRVESQLPPDQQKLLLQARQRDLVLEGRKILLVEDDVRNIFALSSILEPLGAHLAIARNGQEALDHLDAHADVDLVLMDLMMPEMDGLTAMRHIRRRENWANLPIIALTAKAMADDRRECLEAGANDYISKPIDVAKLVSLCRVWMPK